MSMFFALMRETVFAKKFEVDDRELVLEVYIPSVGRFGLSGLDPMFWVQITTLVVLTTILNVILAVVVYKFIIQKQWSATSFVVGYGIVLPFLALLSFVFIELFDLSNPTMVIVSGAGSLLLMWRCLEAMYDTTPKFAKSGGLQNYMLYYTALINFSFDPKTHDVIPISRAVVLRKVARVLSLFVQATVMYSILEPCNFAFFSVSRGDESSLADLVAYIFSPAHIANNFLLAITFSISLDLLSTAMGLALMLVFGYETMDIMFDPMSKSQSASEFWGVRWNTLVSSALKRGVFIPLRKYAHWSRPVAAVCTFLASGLLHEWILLMVAYGTVRDPSGDWQLKGTGHHLAFFGWNGVILFLEHHLRDTPFLVWPSKNLPPLLKTVLVIMSVLPLSHLFSDTYVENGFFFTFAIAFPKIVYL